MMPETPYHSAWLEVSQTIVPALPAQSRLTVQDVSPERFDVTYPVEPGWLFGCLMVPSLGLFGLVAFVLAIVIDQRLHIPWWFTVPTLVVGVPWLISHFMLPALRRPEGGRLQLTHTELFAKAGFVFPWSETYPITPNSKFEVVDLGDDEGTAWALQWQSDVRLEKNVAKACDLKLPDLQWLKKQLNAWLGWEFPSHCVACARPLDTGDIDWQQRSVLCSVCGFAGLAPDPFGLDAAPPPPPTTCPSCQGKIWLIDVNRDTGGCRCQRCRWASDALPPMKIESFDSVQAIWETAVGRMIPAALHASRKFVTDEDLRAEFPSSKSAVQQLQIDQLIEDGSRDQLTIAYRHWQVQGLTLRIATAAIITGIDLWLYFAVFTGNGPNRTWLQWLGQILTILVLPFTAGFVAWGLWWGRKSVRLIFTPMALLYECGPLKRAVGWNTLKEATPHIGIWPPMVYLVYGGAGWMITPPSDAAARAIARLCQFYRDTLPMPASANGGAAETAAVGRGKIETASDSTDSMSGASPRPGHDS